MPIEKRPGSPFWQIRFEVHGRRVRKSTRTTSSRKAEAIERELRTYYEKNTPKRAAGQIDLAGLAELDVARAEADNATDSQLAALEYAWSAIARHMGGTSPATVITYDSVETYIRARKADGVSGQTVRKERQALRRMAEVAHRKGYLPALPLVWPKIKDSEKNKHRAGKAHSVYALRAWFKKLRRISMDAYREARLIALTGLRSEEAARLCWSWVEDASTGPSLKLPAPSTKTRTERRVGLSREAYALLSSMARGRKADEPMVGKRYLRRARDEARVAIGYSRRVTLRDLRHMYLTLGLAATGDATATQAAAGHSDLRTTQRYLHSTIERAQAVSHGVESALSCRTGTATVAARTKKRNDIGGRTRDRTEVHLRVKEEPDPIKHVSTCIYCRLAVIRCMKSEAVETETATQYNRTSSPATRRA